MIQRKLLTFYLSGHFFGVDTSLIKEINRNLDYTPVPDVNPKISGLFNLRGQVITLFQLDQCLGIKDLHKTPQTMCIILKPFLGEEDQVGFFIDTTGDVIEFEKYENDLLPANVQNIPKEYCEGVLKMNNNVLLILDLKKIFETEGDIQL